MQRSVFEGWIGGLDERGFDAPLLALLRSHGFYDIHFTHGQYEFGKDFIAKRTESGRPVQYAFQSKKGDIGGSEWSSFFSQLWEAAGGRLTHPNFDAKLERHCVLVTTGRMKGKAIQSANDFSVEMAGKTEFTVWDREYLLDLARGTHPDFPLRDLHPSIEHIVAEIQLGSLGSRKLFLGLERAVPTLPLDDLALHTASMEATLVIAALRRAGMLLHVPLVAAHLARLGAAAANADVGETAYAESLLIYRAAVDDLLDHFEPVLGSPSDFMDALGGGFDEWFTYPAACLLLGEFLTTALFHARGTDEHGVAGRYRSGLIKLATDQPGLVHPVSERFSVSTIAICAGLVEANQTALLDRVLVNTTVWLCDLLDDDGLGLASAYASPEDEVAYLLGARLDCTAVEREGSSLLAVALVEAANEWLPSVYPDVLNDLLAVEVCPTAVIPKEIPGALFLNGGGTASLLNPVYPETSGTLPWHEHEDWGLAQSIAAAPEAPLVFATACRDRLFQAALFRAVRRLHDVPPADGTG